MQIKSVSFLFLSYFLSFSFFAIAQEKPIERIFFGKRAGSVWNMAIQEQNIGGIYAYRPIFYKFKKEENWQKIGFFGNKLHGFFENDPAKMAIFKKFRTKKIISQLIYPVSYSFSTAWLVASFLHSVKTNHFSPLSLVNNPYSLSFLGGFILSSWGFTMIGRSAEYELIKLRNLSFLGANEPFFKKEKRIYYHFGGISDDGILLFHLSF